MFFICLSKWLHIGLFHVLGFIREILAYFEYFPLKFIPNFVGLLEKEKKYVSKQKKPTLMRNFIFLSDFPDKSGINIYISNLSAKSNKK